MIPTFRKQKAFVVQSITCGLVASVLVACLAPVSFAQDRNGAMPENAYERSFGGGWICDTGYHLDNGACIAVRVPENAFATGRSFGRGWRCRRSFQEVEGMSCREIVIPPHAFLDSTGMSWSCERGFRKIRNRCEPVDVPGNAFLSGDSYGSGWECDRGFSAESGDCVPINVPDNAFLEQDNYGLGWQCERGYEQQRDACVAIRLPENAHLDHSGNRWSCDRGFRVSGDTCVLAR